MKQRVIDFLMGKQPQTAEVNPTSTYGADVDNFINALKEQPYMQKLYNAPIQERLSDEQIAEKVANGLNLGIPELAQAQKDVGIRIPQGTEQVAQAQLGEFNKPMVVAGVNNAPREGGLIQGYKQGYNLNYDNPTNTVGTRIGQALGSIGRFADSSLGRGLIAYGLSNAMGDTNPLEQAFTAGVGRYNAQTADKVYRNQLKQLGMSEEELNNIRGDINSEIYKNISDSYKARWNKANWGDLATISPVVAEAVKLNPELANSYLPASVAKEIMRGDLTEAQIANLLARTEKTKKETDLLGKPKPASVIIHETVGGDSGTKPDKNTRPVQNDYVQMQAPNGKIYKVPKTDIQKYINAGGKVIG